MWSSVGFGFAIGMALYIAMGGENYALMTAILLPCGLLGAYLANRFSN